ncbi:MAG: efflux transporter outer membrane subunit [Akkermansiaceae bacterium]|jgi:multidrug efflux system outer membrane protein|nr:efflux transporter outer membrane subunit [Akkermansiaceae bacterium]
MRVLFLSFGSLLLASCILGPQPRSPEVALPGSIRGDAPGGDSFGEKSWRKVFSDPTLKALIEKALVSNPDLVASTYRIEQARAQAMTARADWFPSLDGSTSASGRYLSPNAGQVGPAGDRSVESFDMTALLSWEIDLWGGIRRSNQAARSRLLAAQYQRDAVKTSLVAAVATAYVELRNLDERLEVSKRTAESRRQSLELVSARRDGGVSSDLEVAQAKALLGQALTAIPVTEQAIAAKENQIRALVGDYPGGVERGGSLAKLESKLRIEGGLPSSLLARRPDIAAADAAYQAALADIGVAESLRYPSLSLTGSGGVVSADLHNLLEGKSGAFAVGPRLAAPIFDAGRNKARVEAAKARAGEAMAEHDKAVKQAFREAADAIQTHAKTGEIIARQRELVEANRQVASVASDRFTGGASSYLEVLDAERALFVSELELIDARRNRLLAVVQAYRALGGGWR